MSRPRGITVVTIPLLELAICCPSCHRPPAIRITEAERALHADADPGEICSTQRCTCGSVYAIPASAYQRAA